MSSLLFITPALGIILWLSAIRPYCVRHRKGYTPGANIGVTAWVDWQDASELARGRGDRGMRIICRIFLALHLVFFGTILILLTRA